MSAAIGAGVTGSSKLQRSKLQSGQSINTKGAVWKVSWRLERLA